MSWSMCSSSIIYGESYISSQNDYVYQGGQVELSLTSIKSSSSNKRLFIP